MEVHTSLFWHGGQRFLLKVARDITDRIHAEEQQERLRQLEADLAHVGRVNILGELAASIAHELKQPLTGVMLNAKTGLRWIQRDSPNLEKAVGALERMVRDGARASEIIDRLQSLYRKAPPVREPVALNKAISEIAALLRSEGTRHAVSIRTVLPDDLPLTFADRVQVQQVLMNLMLNGIESMTDTGGVLTVESKLRQDGQLEVSVRDTGHGLPSGKASQIFEAFYTTKAHGSGMGLAISKSIIESHDGRIWAEDNEGRGATFYFTLPVAVAASSVSPVP